MINSTAIRNTIDSVNRAAAALGVSPYGDDGLTFTRREFNAETKGAHVFDSLQSLRDRYAVVVDHSEVFTHPASLTLTIDTFNTTAFYYRYKTFKPLNVSTAMIEHDIALILRTDNPIAVLASMNANIAKFFADNRISAKNVESCGYLNYINKTIVRMNDGLAVVIKYNPEFEGVRYFYRFDLRRYLYRQSERVKDAITECEEQAAKYQELVAAKTAQAANRLLALQKRPSKIASKAR